ncbi:MAG: M14 family zinc carboxypeptidase [Dehalococcoidia bacterium]
MNSGRRLYALRPHFITIPVLMLVLLGSALLPPLPAAAESPPILSATAEIEEQGTVSGVLPRDGGVAFVVWHGGPLAQLLAATAGEGCIARSVWSMVAGRFVGYSTDAPAFVNASWLIAYPAEIPGPAPVLVVCDGVSVATQPDTPVVMQRLVIGRSVEGRPLEVSCAGDGPRFVLLVGGMHTGTEANTVTIARRVLREIELGRMPIPGNATICVLPLMNPDGIARDEHTNANGVDLNRNWPAENWHPDAYHPASGAVSGGARPLSEPETEALAAFVRDTAPAVVVVWHSYAALVEGNSVPLAGRLGRAYAKASGLEYIEHWAPYPITGQFIDDMAEDGQAAIDVELRWTDDSGSDSHLDGIRALLAELERAMP